MLKPNYSQLAKKRFSQNFLVNQNLLEKVSQSWKSLILKNPTAEVFEIGPGTGNITQALLEQFEKSNLKSDIDYLQKKVIKLIELDTRMVQILEQKFVNQIQNQQVQIIQSDFNLFLKKEKLDFPALFLSNLPFEVGSRMIVDLSFKKPDSNINFILQKEVTQKLNSKNKITLFGAWVNLVWQTKIEFNLSPASFLPSPKVYAQSFLGKPNPDFLANFPTEIDRKVVFLLLKNLFSHPRKTVANNLTKIWKAEQIDTFFEENVLEVNLRLNWQNYKKVLKLAFLTQKTHN